MKYCRFESLYFHFGKILWQPTAGTLLNCSGIVANPADQQGTLVQ
jgi:hypothetical protein